MDGVMDGPWRVMDGVMDGPWRVMDGVMDGPWPVWPRARSWMGSWMGLGLRREAWQCLRKRA